MPARRCSICSINYPDLMAFKACPICDEATSWFSSIDADPGWKERVEKELALQSKRENLAAPVPRVTGVEPYTDAGLLWINNLDLFGSGLHLSRTMPDQFYLFELDDGWVYETQGFDFPNRRWWVERVLRVKEDGSRATTSVDATSSTASGGGSWSKRVPHT